MNARARGWYKDPFGLHEDRYFSEGWPTKLVRDQGQESYDLPPDLPLPDAPLVPADEDAGEQSAGCSDLRRADDAERPRRRGGDSPVRAILDIFDQTAHGW